MSIAVARVAVTRVVVTGAVPGSRGSRDPDPIRLVFAAVSDANRLERARGGGLFFPLCLCLLSASSPLRLGPLLLAQDLVCLVVLAQDLLHLARLGVDRLHLLLERLRRVLAVHAQKRQRAEMERAVVRREREAHVFAPQRVSFAIERHLERLRLARFVRDRAHDQEIPFLHIRRPRRAPHLERARRGGVELVIRNRHRRHGDGFREFDGDPLVSRPPGRRVGSARRARAEVVRVSVLLERVHRGGFGLGVRGNDLRAVRSRRVVHPGGVRVANGGRDGGARRAIFEVGDGR